MPSCPDNGNLLGESSEWRKCVGRARELKPRDAAVLVHATDQIIDRVEHQFVANPVDKGDIDGLAIQVTGKVKQEDFEQNRPDVEHRPAAKTCDAVIAAGAHCNAHPIDAMAQSAGGIELKIGRRIAKLASALIAVHDLTADEPGVTEQVTGLFDVSGGKGLPHRPRRNALAT